MESTLRKYKSPRKRFCRQHLATLATLTMFCDPLVSNFPTELFCKQSPVYGVFWPLLPHLSTDRNETRTWSSLSPWEPSHKMWCKSVHNFLVIVVTDRHTHKPTTVKTYSLAFARIMTKSPAMDGPTIPTSIGNQNVSSTVSSCGLQISTVSVINSCPTTISNLIRSPAN